MIDWKMIRTGRRRGDGWVAVNLPAQRVCFQGYSDRNAPGVLEPLTLDFRLRRIGVYIWAQGWRQPFILKHRGEWLPDDYFIAAARIMGERGIDPQGDSHG